MIAPMKRAFVLVSARERREASRSLRSLGMLHLEAMQGTGEAYEELKADRAALERAIGLLTEYKAEPAGGDLELREGIALAEELLRLEETVKAGHDEAAALTREIERVRPWGDFEPGLAADLAASGVPLRFVSIPVKKLASLPADLDWIRLGEAKGRARLAVIAGHDAALPQDAEELAMPARSLSALEAALAAARARIADAVASIASRAPREAALAAVLKALDRNLAFETVRSGMPEDGPVCWLSGWLPASDGPAFVEAARRHGWGILLDEPSDDEQPPTKVESGPLVRVIQPVFDFLGTVPNYREYDISGLFLLFFVVFFAMIFGDGGYGTLMLLAGIGAALSSRRKTGRVSDPVRLLLMLAAATVVWGALTASWFGIDPAYLPRFLAELAPDAISSANRDAGDNVKLVCFSLGLFQLLVAHLKNILRDIRSLKFLGQLGQFGMVGGIYFIVLNLVISATRFAIPSWALILIGAGFGLNFVFGAYDGSRGFLRGVLGSMMSNLANFVSLFLGVVNIFADLVSYIRLWAVGLAGVGISQTVNQMAGPMVGKLTVWILGGVVLLAFGHGLNIILSVLSVIVHGVRLNMLEFSGHLGMEWSGYKYEPFRDTVPPGRVETERSPS